MKAWLASILILVVVVAEAQTVIASWYQFDSANNSQHVETPDSTASDWTASLTTSTRGSATSAAAQSGTRDAGATGPTVDPTTNDVSGVQANVANTGHATTTFTFTNGTGTNVPLGSFHFDYKKTANGRGTSDETNWGTIDLIAVSNISGAVANEVLSAVAVGAPNYTSLGADVDLTGYTINAGETAAFTLVVTTDGTTSANDPTWHKAVTLDNIALTVGSNVVIQSVFYIDPVLGNDANSGATTNEAWQTLARASSTYPQTYNPGDEILLKRGGTFTDQLHLSGVKGSSAKPIVIGAYGSGDAPVIVGSNGSNTVKITFAEYIEIQDLAITGEGIQIANYWNTGTNTYDHIHLKNLSVYDITGTTSNGIQLVTSSTGGTKFNDVLIADCTISNTVGNAITINKWDLDNTFYHSNVVISNNLIRGAGIQLGKLTGAIVRDNNVLGSTGSDGLTKTDSGLWIWGCQDTLIEKNVFAGARGPTDCTGVHIDIGCVGSIIQYNLSRDNEGGFVEILGLSSNNVYRYNISINDGARVNGVGNALRNGRLFWFGGYTGAGSPKVGPFNNYVYNNTIYVKSSIVANVEVDNTADGVLIANNVIYIAGALSNRTSSSTATNIFFTNNLVYENKTPAAPFVVSDTFNADPQFSNLGGWSAISYTPSNQVDVIDRGIVVSNLVGDAIGVAAGFAVTEDYFGNPILGAPDMGAIETSSLTALAGWHSWSVVNASLGGADSDTAYTGFSGVVGTNVSGTASGGGQQTVAAESGDDTYGSFIAVTNRTVDSSIVLRATDGGNNNIKRLDFSVVNNSSASIELHSIHFDSRLTYGASSNTTLKVSHLSAASDLYDLPWTNFSVMAETYFEGLTWKNRDVTLSTTSLEDLTLADGETAAFRIELNVDAGAIPAGVNIDNISISAYISPNAAGQDTPGSLLRAWLVSKGLSADVDTSVDHDSDGVNTLLEYALGGNPSDENDGGHRPSIAVDQGNSVIRFVHQSRKNHAARGLAYRMQTSSDLVYGTWSNMSDTVVSTNGSGDLDFDVITNQIPLGDTKQKFIRLQVEFSE